MVFKPAAYRLIFDRLKQTEVKRKNKKVKGLLQIEVYFNAQRKYVSTGIRVKPNEWDSKRQEVKSKNPNNETINKKLVRQIKELRDFESTCEDFDLQKLADHLKEGGRRISFIDFYESSLNSNNKLRPNTRRAQNYTLNVLKEFGQLKYFSDLTYANIEKFDYFLRDRNLVQSTIWGHHKQIKVYINLAIKKGLYKAEKAPYTVFKSKMPPSLRQDLTPEELIKLEKLDLEGEIDYIFEVVATQPTFNKS